MLDFLKKLFGTAQERAMRRFWKIVSEVNRWDEACSTLSDEAIRAKTEEFRQRLKAGESLDEILPEAYGVVKNVCRRMMGTEVHVSGYNQKWDMVPYDVQILGAIAMHRGYIAEMQTGEGKTLTATLPLYLNALSGKPVHLVTVNDYLAQRDCEWVGSIMRWLGLKTAVLTTDTPHGIRKEIYQADVVYGTASEFGFDYLRDNSMCMDKEEQVQRGYFYAIVDEIDSILIDEARTPLIISGPTPKSFQMYEELKGIIADFVRKQRDLCNHLAGEAKKFLEKKWDLEVIDKLTDEEKEGCRKLWLVSRGMPHNKILRRAKEHPDLRTAIDNWDLYYHAEPNKEERAETLAELYLVVEEKSNEFELTDKGIQTWAVEAGGQPSDFVMLDLGDEYAKIDGDPAMTPQEKMERKLAINEEDARRKERAHNIRQLLRAHLLMEKDVDYIIEADKIIIIDENTGRPQPGRRYSDGLHQAIEAKEGVAIQRETQTYATITLQNYFRMYGKLAGMTGTAITEANEFKNIYKLDVLQIPTYVSCIREDYNDEVYMTEREKYNAILREIKEVNGKGRPILIGTESVENSEKLSRILKQNKLEHTILNAKHHAKEAEVIAEAGRMGAITVSTNMAGRGTDIKLRAGVGEAGGLHVVGTTRHQSRRIDRQLRGRSARLGDPGSSKFFVSFEDELMRLFSSPKLNALIQRFRPPEGEAISARIINRSIEIAQKRIEGRNFMIRKYTLEYDDVMNKQRQEIYSFRNDILHVENPEKSAEEIIADAIDTGANEFLISRSREGGWDLQGFHDWLIAHFPVSFNLVDWDNDLLAREEIIRQASEKVVKAFQDKLKVDIAKIGQEKAAEIVKESIRNLIIRQLDSIWQEHLLTMDHLRTEVSLRTVGQKDPLLEFKHEAFQTFFHLTGRLKREIAKSLFRIEVAPSSYFQEVLGRLHMETGRLIFDNMESMIPPPNTPDEAESVNEEAKEEEPPQKPVVAAPKVGRNDPCPCKSGKKFKKCCGLSEESV